MQDDMNTRMSHAEWEIKALKEDKQRQDDRMAELSSRMDTHHKEVMQAIGSLRDDRAKAEGAAEARLIDAEMRQNRLKWLSFGLAVIGTLAALGWFGDARAAILPDSMHHGAPIPVQYHARDLP